MKEGPDTRANLERCATECAQRGWRLAFALLQNAEDAADCVQQAFLVAARKPGRVPQVDSRPWLAAVIANEARNLRRKRARRPAGLEPGAAMPPTSPETDPASQAELRERDAALIAALDELPEAEREALMMTQFAGLTYGGAAGALGVPEGTLNGRISRALEKLRRRLGKGDAAIMACIPLMPIAPPPAAFAEQLLAQAASAAVAPTIIIAGVAMKKTTAIAALLVIVMLLLGISATVVADWPEHDTTETQARETSTAPAITNNAPRAGADLADATTGKPTPGADAAKPVEGQTSTETPPVEASVSITVTVRDELTNRPIEGATLVGPGQAAQTDKAGKAVVQSTDIAKGVTARAQGYIDTKVGMPRAGAVEVLLPPVHQGRGMVLDAEGKPAPGARVMMASNLGHDSTPVRGGLFETRSGSDGTFTFPVSIRARDAVATLPDNFHGAEFLLAGQHEVTLKLQTARGLDVFLEGPGTVGIKTLTLWSPPWPEVTTQVANGRAQFRYLSHTSRPYLSSPDRRDICWEVDISSLYEITPFLIYLDEATIKLRVNWKDAPERPVASIVTGGGRVPSLPAGFSRRIPTMSAGRVVSQDTLSLPHHFAPLHRKDFRFLDAEGRVIGFISSSTIKPLSDMEWEVEALPTHSVGGRIVDSGGSPVAGCKVSTYTGGRSSFRNGEAVTGPDGRFEVNIDNRNEVHFYATDGANFADRKFSPETKSFGDVVLGPRRTVRTHLKGAKSDEVFFVYANDQAFGSRVPLPCRAGEFVDVPVAHITSAIHADGVSALHVKSVTASDHEVEIDLDAGPLTVNIVAFKEDVRTKAHTPLAGKRLRVRSGEPERTMGSKVNPFTRTTAIRLITTDESGRATVRGVMPGKMFLDDIAETSLGGGHSYDITTDNQLVEMRQRYFSGPMYPPREHLVPVIGRISPTHGREYVRLGAYNAPLPKPMDGRTARDRGFKAGLVDTVAIYGGGFSAFMDPAFPYITAETEDGSEVHYNAGYLTKVGDIWRCDIVLPSDDVEEAKAKIVVTDGGLGATSLAVKIVWTQDGRVSGRGAHVELGKECEIAWPESAKDVRLFITAQAGERRLAAMASPRADTVNRVTLQVMPPVKLTNTAGLAGGLSLTPAGVNEHEWRDVQSLAKDASTLRLFGSGQYELAGKDASGNVRTKTISVVIRDDTPVIEIDPRAVLQPKEK